MVWGTDSVWYGSPQWQIEALRRLEIPEDLQKKHGFAPLGPADGPVKNAIFAGNAVRMYGLEPARRGPRSATIRSRAMRDAVLALGERRSNLRYGYVAGGTARERRASRLLLDDLRRRRAAHRSRVEPVCAARACRGCLERRIHGAWSSGTRTSQHLRRATQYWPRCGGCSRTTASVTSSSSS